MFHTVTWIQIPLSIWHVTLFCGCFKLTQFSQFRRQDVNSNICQWALLGCVVGLLCPSSKATGRHMIFCTPCPIHRSAQYSVLTYWRHSFRMVVRQSASGSFVTLRGLGGGGVWLRCSERVKNISWVRIQNKDAYGALRDVVCKYYHGIPDV
jgi:hypothetical protein